MTYIKTPVHWNWKSESISIFLFVQAELESGASWGTTSHLDKTNTLLNYCAELTELLVDKGILSVEEVGQMFGQKIEKAE